MTMKLTIGYLVQKHQALQNDYRTSDGRHSESCTLIALEVAELLLAEGKNPEIRTMAEDISTERYVHPKTLRPLLYEGRVEWYAHQVCCAEDIAYDPLVGRPVPVQEYSRTVFGEDVTMKTSMTPEKVRTAVLTVNKMKSLI